jgi:hypothetical protein
MRPVETTSTGLTFDGDAGVTCQACGQALPTVPATKVTEATLAEHAHRKQGA